MINSKLKKVFTNLLGDGIELTSIDGKINTEEDIGKVIFIEFMEKWKNSWKVRNTLFNKYGIDLEGYDNQLYSALENLLLFALGYVKSHIIMNYIYADINQEVEKFQITDKNGVKYYISNVEELYDFIKKINDSDFMINENEE